MASKKNQRRNAFEGWGEAGSPSAPEGEPRPPSPLDLIPKAEPRQRNRDWDLRHRAWSYKIPESLREKAVQVRDAITGIAQSGSTTTDEVAKALVSLALEDAEHGDFTLQGHPDPQRQKLVVVWEESASNWPQAIPEKKTRMQKKSKEPVKSLYLAYRWPDSTHQQICRVSGNNLARGEVVVHLLSHGLDAYRGGRLRLTFQPKNSAIGGWS